MKKETSFWEFILVVLSTMLTTTKNADKVRLGRGILKGSFLYVAGMLLAVWVNTAFVSIAYLGFALVVYSFWRENKMRVS